MLDRSCVTLIESCIKLKKETVLELRLDGRWDLANEGCLVINLARLTEKLTKAHSWPQTKSLAWIRSKAVMHSS